MCAQFQARGYPVGAVSMAEQRARTRTRESLFIQKRVVEKENKKLCWALDFTPRATCEETLVPFEGNTGMRGLTTNWTSKN